MNQCDPVVIEPIGIIHTPFKTLDNMPIQPRGAQGVRGTLEIFPPFEEGLKDVELFSHIYLLYHFHRASRKALKVVPFMDTVERGVFATRSPLRPSFIGLSGVKLVERKGPVLTIENVDILDGTPLLDIKPYVPQFDTMCSDASSGWIDADKEKVAAKRSDRRFI